MTDELNTALTILAYVASATLVKFYWIRDRRNKP